MYNGHVVYMQRMILSTKQHRVVQIQSEKCGMYWIIDILSTAQCHTAKPQTYVYDYDLQSREPKDIIFIKCFILCFCISICHFVLIYWLKIHWSIITRDILFIPLFPLLFCPPVIIIHILFRNFCSTSCLLVGCDNKIH